MKSSSLFESPISYSLETIKKGEDEKIHGSQDVRFKMIEDIRFYAQSLRVNGD